MKLDQVETVVDSERGCGWRKPGGIYLRADAPNASCGKLPLPLAKCPCCGGGIKPARGWSWINPRPLFELRECTPAQASNAFALGGDRCKFCPCGGAVPDKAGLLWIGEKFYPTPHDWISEAVKLGVSRRIPRVPAGFKLGDRVYAAHRKAIKTVDPAKCDCQPQHDLHTEECACFIFTPAIFHTFTPTRIEYVCKGTETEKELDALVKRGLTPVLVRRDTDLPPQAPAHHDDGEAEALAIEAGQE